MVKTHQEINPIDYEEVTVGASAIGLTANKLTNDIVEVLLVVSGGPLRTRMDGTDPTAALGIPMFDGQQFWLPYKAAKKAKFIREGATNGTIHATFCDIR